MERVFLPTLAVWAFAATTCTADLPDPKYALNQCEDPHKQFDCGDGNCIPNMYVCDTRKDCRNGADESFCDPRWEISRNMYHCTKDNKNIPKWKRCDGTKQCSDGQDEKNCPGCFYPFKYKCKDVFKYKCISVKRICDGVKDCRSGDDEKNCPSLTYSLPGTRLSRCEDKNNTYDCGDGECVLAEQICSSEQHRGCYNKADSAGCPSHEECDHENQYKCQDGKCIAKYHICDGKEHCDSDEKDCPEDCTGPNQVRCESLPLEEEGSCLSRDKRCSYNGYPHCPGGEEEAPFRICPNMTYDMNAPAIG